MEFRMANLLSRLISARYSGVCSTCGARIIPGDVVVYYPSPKRTVGPCCRDGRQTIQLGRRD